MKNKTTQKQTVKQIAQQELINFITARKTKGYYADLEVIEKEFDRTMSEVSPSLFQSHPVGTLPCERLFLEKFDSLRLRYRSEMRELVNICNKFDLMPNKILQRFRPSEQSVLVATRKPSSELRV